MSANLGSTSLGRDLSYVTNSRSTERDETAPFVSIHPMAPETQVDNRAHFDDPRADMHPGAMSPHILERGPPAGVHEIAKEVAALLGPQMRSQTRAPPTNVPPTVLSPRPVRQLPVPRNFGPKSPGPPQYER